MSRKMIVAGIVFMALFVSCTRSQVSGGFASDFSLEDLNGKKVKLSDFKGKPVLLDFWATWCPPCQASIPGIEKLHRMYSSKGLAVLGISLDQGDWDSVKGFVAQYGITYTVLKGDDDVSSKYQVRTIPMLVILDKDGKIVRRYLGFDGEGEIEKDIKALL